MKKLRPYNRIGERLSTAARALQDVRVRSLGEIASHAGGYPFWMVESPPSPGKKRVCLSAGIHGDEPAGVETVLQWIENLGEKKNFFEDFQFTIFPCINPFGYEYDVRENGAKVDLNREFDKEEPQNEIQFLKAGIAGRRFDFAYECHEDVDSPGYYLYEMSRNGRKPIGPEIIDHVQRVCPINRAEVIEEMPAQDGVIQTPPQLDADFLARLARRDGWPQTVYLSAQGSEVCITAETPTRLEIPQRIAAHLLAFETALTLI